MTHRCFLFTRVKRGLRYKSYLASMHFIDPANHPCKNVLTRSSFTLYFYKL